MKMVLEEVEGTVARLIPDNGSGPFYLMIHDLPKDSEIGDVLDVYYQKELGMTKRIIKRHEKEKENRMAKMKSKREALLRKNKKNMESNS